jgi:multiple antibiotic resistance protein
VELFWSAVLTLFFVMDPVGNLPLFLASTKKVDPKRVQWIIARELIVALVLMIIFLFVGGRLLQLLHVTAEALSVGGGLILMLIAIRMVFPSSDNSLKEEVQGEPFIVPMAVPYVAGPSVLATEVVLINQNANHWYLVLGALLTAWLGSSIILFAAGFLQRMLGERVLSALERLMGMLLVVISAQMLLSGIQEFFKI